MTGFVERSWTTPDDLRLSGRDYPGAAGPARLPVVCLHGLTRNARDFEDAAPRIAARGRRVLAFDVRGRGLSGYDSDPQRYGVPTYVADMIGWVRALGIGRAVFVGTSMGGLISMALASVAPDLVASVVLNDIGPQLAPEGLARISGYAGAGEPVETWPDAAAYARKINATAFPHYGDTEWAAFARRLFTERDGRPVLDYDRAIAIPFKTSGTQPAPDLWPLFDRLATERSLLLLRGELSDLLTSEIADAMKARAPQMTVCEVAGVGHAPSLSEPEAVYALMAFLETVD